ncbi:MAG: ATP-binding cassette domain-containing protein [Planctomycetota bacterium]
MNPALTTNAGSAVRCTSRPSARLRTMAAVFGLRIDRGSSRVLIRAAARAHARQLDRSLRPGQLAWLTGPSGSGKSSVLAELSRRVHRRGGVLIEPDEPALDDTRTLADRFDGPMAAALATLARAGLGEPRLLARTPAELSEGQRARVRLADAIHQAGRDDNSGVRTLVFDEFASVLDRVTARALAVSVRRWAAGSPGVRVVCASAHDDLGDWLAPDLTIELGAP